MRRRLLATLALLAALVQLAGCAAVRFDTPGAADEAAFRTDHPLYAEYCALSQIRKKPGFGADIRGEIGGHAVFYLNGACRDDAAHYPVLRPCGPGEPDGVGLSMNAHFRNAKWVATPGRDFFFSGELAPDAPVTRATYEAIRTEAMRRGIYDGVRFNDWVFADKPAGWDDDTWRYEVSIATDWAIALGRGRYCTRVPVDATQMRAMIDFLNAQNAPYRAGTRVFRWNVFNDNCIHLAHNALAAAGLWPVWPIERPLPIAVFDFPVPRNEFVNLARRLNDHWLPDPGAVYHDLSARTDLLEHGQLPTRPGGLVEARGPQRDNQVYDTDNLKMIFFDEPTFGRYQADFDRIFAEPRYLDAAANARWFAARAAEARAARRPPGLVARPPALSQRPRRLHPGLRPLQPLHRRARPGMVTTRHLVLIPSYNPGPALRPVVQEALAQWQPVWVVSDGSTDRSNEGVERLGARLVALPRNRGKGEAVRQGLLLARAEGFTHALVMDADGQHPASRIRTFIAASAARPAALILGQPEFGLDAPLIRLAGRRIANRLTGLLTREGPVADALFGFRVYPIAPLLDAMAATRFMRGFDFEPEAAIRLVRMGLPVLNLPAPVRYIRTDQGGVSHFRYGRDNLRLGWMFTRLLLRPPRRPLPARPPAEDEAAPG